MSFNEIVLFIVALTIASGFAFWLVDQFPDEEEIERKN